MEENILNLEEELSNFKGQWFVINCNSGHEDRVRSDLLQKIEISGLSDRIFDIRISKGPGSGRLNKFKEKNKFPGYIFINMIMTDETWFIVRNTPGVNGFIGSSGKGAKPLPLTIDEVINMLDQNNKANDKNNKSNANKPKKEKILFKANFNIKDVVSVKEGPFAKTEGQVMEMDFEKGIAVVNIELFGRITPTEFEFNNLEKAYNN